VILKDIKRYLMKRPFATLRDIALHVDAQPDAVRGMLEKWVRKGKVAKQLATSSCGSSCSKCDVEATEIYRWRDNEVIVPILPDKLPDHCDTKLLRNG
jgi:hypothetical protein